MFKAIGFIMILWFVSSLFTKTFTAADEALKATFNALEAAAVVTEINITNH